MPKLDLFLQLKVLGLGRNQLSGTLPGSWLALTQASHATTTSLKLKVVTVFKLCTRKFLFTQTE